MPGSPAHLVRRFFDVASARALTDSERAAVDEWLPSDLAAIFYEQPDHDQRHGYHAALSVVASRTRDSDMICAALLHDVGKRHANLGIFGRSLASILIIARVPVPERVRVYRDHGIIGARELGLAGAPSLVIDFALHHHGSRPPTIAPDAWETLVAADQPPKTLSRGARWITSGNA